MSNGYQDEFYRLAEPQLLSLYNTALRMSHNSDDAQDLVQETLYKAYKNFRQFEKNTNFRAWIFRILINSYITEYRRTKRQPKQESFDDLREFYLYRRLDEDIYIGSYGKDEFIENMFDDDVKKSLELIPERYRLIVLLKDVHDFSYLEIADMVKIPLGTVMSRLFRGRKLLQKYLWKYARRRFYSTDEEAFAETSLSIPNNN